MPEQNGIETISSVVNATVIGKTKVKRPFYKAPKFIAAVLLLFVLIGVGFGIARVIYVYQHSRDYKKAYNIVEAELNNCDKIMTEKQSKDVFDYCDKVQSKFKDIKRGL